MGDSLSSYYDDCEEARAKGFKCVEELWDWQGVRWDRERGNQPTRFSRETKSHADAAGLDPVTYLEWRLSGQPLDQFKLVQSISLVGESPEDVYGPAGG